MVKFSRLFSRIPLYVLLLGLYPVLFLWMANVNKVHSYVVPRSLFLSAGFTLVIFLLTWLIIRPLPRAGLVAGIWLFLFFSYGHVFSLVDNASLLGFVYGRHRFMIILWAILGITGSFYAIRSRSNLAGVTRSLNTISTILTVLVLVQIMLALIALNPVRKNTEKASSTPSAQSTSEGERDIYYLLLDGYGRSDLLAEDLNLDILPFIDQLKEIGFIIPPCGMSNYTDTALSMASIFNMEYIDTFGPSYEEITAQDHETLLTPYIIHSQVREKFEAMGYQWISYKSPYLFLDMPDSDIYLDTETAINPGEKLETLNFQRLFINTTFARTAAEWLEENPEDSSRVPVILVWLISPGSLNPESSSFAGRNYKQYRQNLFQLETLDTMPETPGRKFVYNHMLITHQPFTFTPTGEFRTEGKDSYNSYQDQIQFINTRLIGIIENILNKSDVPPIIIIQSDHSFSDGGKRAKNFQAYYLPGVDSAKVPHTFTNVNTFRLILTEYFNEELPLLSDASYLVNKKYEGFIKVIPPSCPENDTNNSSQ